MGFFGFLFWLVVIWCAFRIWRRWQWERLDGGPARQRPGQWMV